MNWLQYDGGRYRYYGRVEAAPNEQFRHSQIDKRIPPLLSWYHKSHKWHYYPDVNSISWFFKILTWRRTLPLLRSGRGRHKSMIPA
jgi:hypothetical protein